MTAELVAIPDLLRKQVGDLHVPPNREAAAKILENLYNRGADEVISAAFNKFVAILGADHDATGYCYMAEINLGMAGCITQSSRIETAIGHFRSKLQGYLYQSGSLNYTIGNALSALGREDEAKKAYETSLEDQATIAAPEMAAQVYKNLGSGIERLGNRELAVTRYHQALRLDPNLPEAHASLGNYYIWTGQYQDALDHFDRVVFTERQLGVTSAVAGWRVNALFNIEDGRSAFREINTLLSCAGN